MRRVVAKLVQDGEPIFNDLQRIIRLNAHGCPPFVPLRAQFGFATRECQLTVSVASWLWARTDAVVGALVFWSAF